MMAELIRKEDTLNEGREKLNEAIKDSNMAKEDSSEALDKADTALANSESTQTQLDTIVIEGDSSVEAAQARVDEKGQSHTTLKKRIDDGFTKVTSQLAHEAQQREEDFGYLEVNKASHDYVDNKISNLDGLNFKGAFNTVQDLENAYPSGTSGLYVIYEDNHWYFWGGSKWEQGRELVTDPLAEYMYEQDEKWEVS